MDTYCVKCRKSTKTVDPKVTTTKNNRKMMKGKCAICKSGKCRFLKK